MNLTDCPCLKSLPHNPPFGGAAGLAHGATESKQFRINRNLSVYHHRYTVMQVHEFHAASKEDGLTCQIR